MGEATPCKTSDGFCQTRSQEEIIQPSHPSEIVGQIKGVLGGEEDRQEVIPLVSIPCHRLRASDRSQENSFVSSTRSNWYAFRLFMVSPLEYTCVFCRFFGFAIAQRFSFS